MIETTRVGILFSSILSTDDINFLYFDFPFIVDTRLLTERKTVLYTTITQAQKVAGSLIVSCENYKPYFT